MQTRLIVPALLLCLAAAGPAAREAAAAWPSTGAAATTASSAQTPLVTVGTTVCPDDEGGLIVAWRSGAAAIRANRLDAEDGQRLWGSDGVALTSTAGGPPHVVRDGLGGAWVVWRDTRVSAPGLYVQRLDAAGAEQFTAGGLLFSSGAIDSQGDDDVDVDVTPSGDLLVAYWDVGVRLHRLARASGAAEFGPTGIQLSTDPQVRALDLEPDGEGAFVVWESQRAGYPGLDHIAANRVNAAGTELWGDEGLVLQSQATVVVLRPRCAWDGSRLFVVWAHHPAARTGLADVNAQALDGNGVAQWGTTAGGVSVLFAPQNGNETTPQVQGVTRPAIESDGSGGCIVTWQDGRNYHLAGAGGFLHGWDLYGQRLNASGAAQWTANGQVVDDALGEQYEHVMVPDGGTGVILVYTTYENTNRDIAALRLNANGTRAWKQNISNFAADEQRDPVAAPDGFGGVLAAWEDERNASTAPDVYATHRASGGGAFAASLALTAPDGGERLIAGIGAPVTWTSNFGGNVKLEYQRAGFARGTILASTPNDGSQTWYPPNLPSAQVKVHVSMPSDGLPADSSNATFMLCGPPFATGATRASLAAARGVTAADFDEDGVLDLAVAVTGGLAIALGQSTAGVANGTFAAPVGYAMGSYGRGVVARDFDEDGILDLAVTSATGVGLFFGDGAAGVGDGTFGAVSELPTGAEAAGIAAGDFDEDGITDLAIANSGSNTLSILRGTGANGVGNGGFAAPSSYATATSPQRVVTGDFDADGVTDLAVTCPGSNVVQVFLGQGAGADGDGTFAAGVSYAAGTGAHGLATGDFDEDGHADLAVGNSSPQVSILLGNGDGTFGARTPFNGEGGNHDIVVGDFTGDGIADLAVAASTYNQVTLYAGGGTGTTGDGTFAFATTYGTGAFPEALAAGDFDASGTADLASANRGTNNAIAFEGDLAVCNTLSEALAVTVPNTATPRTIGTELAIAWTAGARVTAVDVELSRDGGANWETLAGRVTGNSFAWTVTGPPTSQARVRVVDPLVASRNDASDVDFTIDDGTSVTLLAPDGGGTFAAPAVVGIEWTANLPGNVKLEYQVGAQPRQSIAASTPNDGQYDWALPLADLADVRVHVSDAADGTPADASDAPFSICTRVAADPATLALIGSLNLHPADLNEDGIMDLVAPSSFGIGVLLGNGSGFDAVETTIVQGSQHRDVTTGDFDADGIPDVALATAAGAAILLGNGAGGAWDGTFAAPVTYPAGSGPREIVAADFDADGILDLAVANSGDSTLSVLRGNGAGGLGDGTFAAAATLQVGRGPSRVLAHDLDRDGALDLVCTNGNSASNSVSVLLGLPGPDGPTGTFAPEVEYALASNPNGLAIADFDGDGAADLAVGGNTSIGLAILPGQTDGGGPTGTFGAPVTHPIGLLLSALVATDLDRDGNVDVVAVSSTTAQVRFFLGRGDGTFAAAGGLPVGSSPNGIVAGDFDADSLVDFAVPAFTGNVVTLVRGAACGGGLAPAVAVAAPAGGETWTLGSLRTIAWTKSGAVPAVDVELSRDGGLDWQVLAAGATGTEMEWKVSGPASTDARVRVRDASRPSILAVSPAFAMQGAALDAGPAALPAAFGVRLAGPNPFRGPARLELALPRATPVEVSVYDVVGRRVRSLARGTREAGRHALEWDGRDASGRLVPSGLYLVRARGAGGEAVVRLVRAS